MTYIEAMNLFGFENRKDINSIKNRYKQLAKIYHPDTSFNGSVEMMQKINEAKEILISKAEKTSNTNYNKKTYNYNSTTSQDYEGLKTYIDKLTKEERNLLKFWDDFISKNIDKNITFMTPHINKSIDLYDKTIQSINDIKFFNSADKNTIDAIINTFEHQKELSLNHILKSLINDYFNKVFFRINNPKNEKFHFDIDYIKSTMDYLFYDLKLRNNKNPVDFTKAISSFMEAVNKTNKTIDFYKLRFKRINDLKYDINKFASYQKKRLLLHKANRLFKVNKDDFNICFLLANRNLNNSTPRYKKKALLKAKKKRLKKN